MYNFNFYNNHIHKPSRALRSIVVERKATNIGFSSASGHVQVGRALFVMDKKNSVRPRWSRITCARNFALFFCDAWKPFLLLLGILWFTLVAVAIPFVWTYRSRSLFDQGTSTPTAPTVSTWFIVHWVRYPIFSATVICYGAARAIEESTSVILTYWLSMEILLSSAPSNSASTSVKIISRFWVACLLSTTFFFADLRRESIYINLACISICLL